MNDDSVSVKHDSDDEDDDETSSTLDANRFLHLKSDPILEKYIDDDSCSTSSNDSEQQELERQLTFLSEKTEAYWRKYFQFYYFHVVHISKR